MGIYTSVCSDGAWEAMVKQFKIVLSHILDTAVHKPKLVELLTYVGSAVRIVNERLLVPLSDDPRDFTAITPALLLTPYLDPHVAVGQLHDRDMLRRDYRFNLSLSQQFMEKWIAFYLPWLQGRKKWLKVSENLKPGQLVVMSSLENISKRGRYKLGRIEEVIPQIRNGKPIVRWAEVAVTKVNETMGGVISEYVLRDVSRLAPVENALPVAHLERVRTTAVASLPVNTEMCSKLIAIKCCVRIINHASFPCAFFFGFACMLKVCVAVMYHVCICSSKMY